MLARITLSNQTFEVAVSGRVDMKTSNDFYQAIFSNPDIDNAIARAEGFSNGIKLDFTDVEYMSSAGLRVIVLLVKKVAPNRLTVKCNANSHISELLELSGVLSFIDVVNE